ncbi:TIGR03619 family F420-dependent LLM class oxidoreductase [Nocardia sp. NBC_01388]|uniref:TIGR03619 family F420-dependent LLM class oxidoreductase n=1 Tax=Nocardia sp. NBC_01388 TaxID=2903596 RepID=UPI0032558735
MKIGLMTTPRESAADTVAVAQMAEARGIESIWLGEHSHLPTATKHAFHEETPDFYKRVPDPYVTLAAAATATERIRLGTAISLPAEHNPITLAKMIATLDHASGGRFDWGIGYGWNQLEMVNRGLDPLRRMATLREVVLAVRALWTSEVTSFDGKHVSFTESWCRPKPVQAPHPPILLGCRPGPRAFTQLAEFCDGWMPNIAMISDLEANLHDLNDAWRRAERVGTPRLTFIDTGFWTDIGVEDYRDYLHALVPTLESLAQAGGERVILGMPLFRMDDAERMLDQLCDATAIEV